MSASPAELADAAQALAAALLAACADPADSVRLLAQLAAFAPDDATSSTAVGLAMAAMQDAGGDLYRRAAIAALARASQIYQPSSSDDAMTVRNLVTGLLDAEITIAGDQSEDDVYAALRTLRLAVVTDLNAKGAGLAAMTTITVGAALPALVLAHRLYRDASRADELVIQADPVHPGFMPLSFRALQA